MELEEALDAADTAIFAKTTRRLKNVERAIFHGAWQGQTYSEIASQHGYTGEYLSQDVGPKLWKLLSDALSERVCKTNFQSALERWFRSNNAQSLYSDPTGARRHDWGEAPDISIFYGRERELHTLTTWVEQERCRLLLVVGMGGIGKTSLATKLAYQLQSQFTTVCWRSLYNAPTLSSLLPDLIQVCSQESDTAMAGSTTDDRISQLLRHLNDQRCLLILDNVEAILQSGNAGCQAGNYRSQYEDYQQLFERIGTSVHQSCLVLTSREKPASIAYLGADSQPIRLFPLMGLDVASSHRLFDAKALSASLDGRAKLVEIYTGNPLALKIVATTIDELFDRDIDRFLVSETFIFDEIRQLFDHQFDRLSEREQTVMYWLAIERALVSLTDLRDEIIPPISTTELIETLKSLGRRCLIEQSQGKFAQQAAIVEYVTERLIKQVVIELQERNVDNFNHKIPLWWTHPLLKALSPEHVRTGQRLQILQPIVDRLILQFGSIDNLVQHLQAIVSSLQASNRYLYNYGGGNLFNLCQHLQIDLSGYDFSHLAMWQVDLQGMTLHDVNFTGADLSRSLFTKTFGRVYASAISSDACTLATSDDSGAIWLWRISDQQPIGRLVGHTNFAWSLMFTPNDQILISAGQDGKIGIWDLNTQEHQYWLKVDDLPVHSVAYLETQELLASGHSNGCVRLWSLQTGQEIAAWNTYDEGVYKSALPVQFSPDGRILAIGSRNGAVQLWNTSDWQLATTLTASPNQFFYALAFSYDGRLLVGGGNHELFVWDVATGEVRHRLQGHQNRLVALVASPNSQILASGSVDSKIKIWDLTNGQLIKTIADHSDWIWSLQFSPTVNALISSCADQSVRFWDLTTWKCLQVWKGYNNQIWALTFNADGSKLVTGSQDGCVPSRRFAFSANHSAPVIFGR
jgi:WD40 repeat protein